MRDDGRAIEKEGTMNLRTGFWVGALALVAVTAAGCGGSCGLVGTWKGVSSGNITFVATFKSDGTYTDTATAASPPGATPSMVSGSWTLTGTTFTFTDSTGCGSGMATYTLTFDPSCNGFTLTNGQDSCAGRLQEVNGLAFARQ
jgi:hypothetical protein